MHRTLALVAGALGVLALAAGEPHPARRGSVASPTYVSAVELARWIRDAKSVRLLDVRSESAFKAYHIPTAAHVSLTTLSRRVWSRSSVVVVYAEDDARAAEAAAILRNRGVDSVSSVRGGLLAWIEEIAEPRLVALSPSATPEEHAVRREQLALSRYFGGMPFVSPFAEPVRRAPPPSPATQLAPGRPNAEAAAVARVLRRGC
jgi:rhodanese-related sulfurtransferase